MSKTDDYAWATEFFKKLKHQRKFALRLGRLAEEQAFYNIKPDIMRKVLSGTIPLEQLKEQDFSLSMNQKVLTLF